MVEITNHLFSSSFFFEGARTCHMLLSGTTDFRWKLMEISSASMLICVVGSVGLRAGGGMEEWTNDVRVPIGWWRLNIKLTEFSDHAGGGG